MLVFRIRATYSGGCPLLSQEGCLREAQAGWFPYWNLSEWILRGFGFGTTPPAALRWLAHLFLDAAATPPNLGGDTRSNTWL